MNPFATFEKILKNSSTKVGTCILLLDTSSHLAPSAEKFAKTLFDVKCITHCERSHRKLPSIVQETIESTSVDYVFNFLSPLKVSSEILRKAKVASINFHPAPPEYPGVGCASYALFNALLNDQWEYGVTAHLMEESYDSGTILKVERFPISKGDYCDTLFERALDYTLILFYNVLNEIACNGMLKPGLETWKRKSTSRKEFEKWMILDPNDPNELNALKIRATHHNRFNGPYIEAFNQRFALPARKD